MQKKKKTAAMMFKRRQTTVRLWPPVLFSPSGSKRSKDAVAPSCIGRNLRTPQGVGVLTRPILPYSAVWRWPLFPHSRGGMYLKRRASTKLHNSPCNFYPWWRFGAVLAKIINAQTHTNTTLTLRGDRQKHRAQLNRLTRTAEVDFNTPSSNRFITCHF